MEKVVLLKEKFLKEINENSSQALKYEINIEDFDVFLNKKEDQNENLFICLNENITLAFNFLEEEIYFKSNFSKDIPLREMNKLKLIMKEIKELITKLF